MSMYWNKWDKVKICQVYLLPRISIWIPLKLFLLGNRLLMWQETVEETMTCLSYIKQEGSLFWIKNSSKRDWSDINKKTHRVGMTGPDSSSWDSLEMVLCNSMFTLNGYHQPNFQL